MIATTRSEARPVPGLMLAVRLTQTFAVLVALRALGFVANQWVMEFSLEPAGVSRAEMAGLLGATSSLLLACVALWLAALLAAQNRARTGRRFGIALVCPIVALSTLPALAECRMPPRATVEGLLPWAWLAVGGLVLVSWLRVYGLRSR